MRARHCRRVEGGALEQRARQHHREVRARHPRHPRLQSLATLQRASGPTGRSSATVRLRACVLVVLVHLLEREEAHGRQPVPRAVRARLVRLVRVTSGVGFGIRVRGRATADSGYRQATAVGAHQPLA